MRWYRKRKVLITGGSSGIGLAAARFVVGWGADVAIVARGEQRLCEAQEELRSAAAGGRVVAARLDVADRAAVDATLPSVLEELGGLDLLVNCAGISRSGYLHAEGPEAFEATMRVNYLGTVYPTLALLPHFRAQGHGHVANVSSVAGFLGVFGYTAYAPSKFAVAGFSECLRQDLLPYGVGVSVLFPPDTDTPMFHEENESKPPETSLLAGTDRAAERRRGRSRAAARGRAPPLSHRARADLAVDARGSSIRARPGAVRDRPAAAELLARAPAVEPRDQKISAGSAERTLRRASAPETQHMATVGQDPRAALPRPLPGECSALVLADEARRASAATRGGIGGRGGRI